MLYKIERKQLIKKDIAAVWAFMSDPANLARITPPSMQFQVLTEAVNKKMFPGQIIEYYIRPVANIKMHWVTEITHVKDREYFIDEQRFGPYAFWHHKHFFREVPEGVEMVDLVHYKIPYGFIGRLANHLFVKRQLEHIFNYRLQTLNRLFNAESKS